jgi:hypothetical protein
LFIIVYDLSKKKRKRKEKKETRLKGKEIKGKKRLSCLKPSKRDSHFFAEKGDLSKRRTDEASQTERKKDKNTERNGKNIN